MKEDNVFDRDFLNHKFNKENIYKAYLCNLVITEGYLQVIVDSEIVGFMNNDLFLDFSNGNVFSVLKIDEYVKYNSPGKYAVSPVRLYERKGRIRPIDVLCDFDNEHDETSRVESRSKVLKRMFNRK